MNEIETYVARLIDGGGDTLAAGGWKGQALVTFPSGLGQFEVMFLVGKPKRGRTFVRIGVDAGQATVGQIERRATHAALTQAASYSRQQGVAPTEVPIAEAAALVLAARPAAVAAGSELETALAFVERLPQAALAPLDVPEPPAAPVAVPTGGGFDYWFFDAFDLDGVGVALPSAPPEAGWADRLGSQVLADDGLRARTTLCLALAARVAGWGGDAGLQATLLSLLAQHRAAPEASWTTAALWARSVEYATRRFDADQKKSPGDPDRLDALSRAHVGQRGAPKTSDLMGIHLAEVAVATVGDGPSLRKAALRLGHAVAMELRNEAEEGLVRDVMPDAREDLAGGQFGDVLPAMLEMMGRFAVEVCTSCTGRCLEAGPLDPARLVRNGVHPFRIGKPWTPNTSPEAAAARPKGKPTRRRKRRR